VQRVLGGWRVRAAPGQAGTLLTTALLGSIAHARSVHGRHWSSAYYLPLTTYDSLQALTVLLTLSPCDAFEGGGTGFWSAAAKAADTRQI
jgi:hypothetical protein